MLPKSALRFLKSCCCCGCQIFTLPLQFMPVYTGCVHVLAMAHEHLQLAVSQDAGFDTDKGMPQLVKLNFRLKPVCFLIGFPAAIERVF